MRFALPYVVIRILGIGLYVRVTTTLHSARTSIIVFTSIATIGMATVLVGIFTEPDVRIWWWLAAIVFDMLAGLVAGRLEG
ncbi:MAG: hypothetical protein HN352_09905 [Bacteroidetes bacterium]|jgi:low temperature requirement protein LtrA|nr:hypothetical protein [Bacteroidota bacterium]MBT3750817.1 hypothetical protein [Bacteroidota bacterium]MBT4399865.1 hypothetical protein [Bacteroidota bacterium]MBT4409359.1 hypothetical protein [Bacteroidota bacterium]MBT5426728.1 hypothetical protein [Bacteroidota bacterium]